ncbi:MAG: hypothetical protein ACR2ML_07970 [Solirubrobacteraceae bacterium]
MALAHPRSCVTAASFVVLEALAYGTPLEGTAAGLLPEFLRAVPD